MLCAPFLQGVSLSPFRSLHQLLIFTHSTITFVVRDGRQTACSIYLVLHCLNIYDLEIPNPVCVNCFFNYRSTQFHFLTTKDWGSLNLSLQIFAQTLSLCTSNLVYGGNIKFMRFRFGRIFSGTQHFVDHSDHQLFSAVYHNLFHDKLKKKPFGFLRLHNSNITN